MWLPDRRDFLAVTATALTGITTRRRLRAPLRFGLLTDTHYADADPVGTRFYRESLAKVREAVTQIRADGALFLGVLGDLKDMAPKEAESRTLTHLAAIEAEVRRFGGPTYHVLGNHDMDNIAKAQMLAGITNSGISAARGYYAFRHGGIRFLVLDACFLEDGRDYDRGNFDWRQTWVPAAELAWLERELAATRDPVIVLAHQRIDGEGDVFVKNAPAVRAVMERSAKVLAVFTGHDHAGAYTLLHGIHYYTQCAVIEGSGPDHNAYTTVDVDADHNLIVTGYRRAISQAMMR